MPRGGDPSERTSAMLRGLDFLERYALAEACWSECSADVQYMFLHLGTRPRQAAVARRARALARQAARRWCVENPRLPSDASPDTLVWYYGYGAYTPTKLGMDTRALRRDLAKAVRGWTATELVGASPRTELPPPRTEKAYELWQNALVGAHVADALGLDVGCTSRDAIAWRAHLLPYPDARRRLSWRAWQAFYAITHLVYVLDDYSRLALHPGGLAAESAFVRDVCEHGIRSGDVELLGESLDVLLALDEPDDGPLARRARAKLLRLQNRDGSWGPRSDEPYTRFHKTWVALDGLADYGRRARVAPRLPPPRA